MTSILQKVMDIPKVLSHLVEVDMKGCIKYFIKHEFSLISNNRVSMCLY